MSPGERGSQTPREIIGLVPAGGQASRIAPLPCSKEVFPVGFRPVRGGADVRPKVAIHYLLERMRFAGVTKAYIILRQGKWDIPGYLNDGKLVDMSLAYLMMDQPFGVPFTLNQANPFVCNALVVFGFPDILFEPVDALTRLLGRQAESEADLVLGLFPARQTHKMDMVQLDEAGGVVRIQIKPARTNLTYAWLIAVWTPVFTHYMREFVAAGVKVDAKTGKEVFVGDVIQAAIHDKVRIDKVIFAKGDYLDIGTPGDLARAVLNGLGEGGGCDDHC